MKAQPLTNATRRLGAPVNWDHEHDGICHTLEICDRSGWMLSAWKPTEAELRELNEGGVVVLAVQGTSHPVVGLSVETLVEK